MPGEEYLVALGHIPVEMEDPVPPQYGYTAKQKKGLWNGLKSMFNGSSSTGSNKSSSRESGRRSRGGPFGHDQLQSLSYSCLGNKGERRAEEEVEYHMRDSVARLSRNLSLSHESVFQMDPHISQVGLNYRYICIFTSFSFLIVSLSNRQWAD